MLNITAERLLPTPIANSTLLPFLLLSLAGNKFVPETKSCFKKEYDYIIVGAGSAGSVLANRLSEIPYANVLLLEAGGKPATLSEVPVLVGYLLGSYYDWRLTSVPQKYTGKFYPGRKVPLPMGKALGGSSSLNGMLIIRGNRYNYDGWRNGGATGWGYEDVLPYFKKLESMRAPQYFNTNYHGFSGPITAEILPEKDFLKKFLANALRDMGYQFVDVNGENQYGFFDYYTSTTHGRRCSTAKAYLVPADHRTNLDIVSDAFVRKVIIENEQAVGVEVEFGGTTNIIRAKEEVILSAGAIHTPQILMLSGIGPKEHLDKFNITVEANLPVGKNLQDHFGVTIRFETDYKLLNMKENIRKPENILKYVYSGEGFFASLPETSGVGFLSNETVGSGSPDFQIYFSQGLPVLEGVHPKLSKGKSVVSCDVNALQPKSRGSITLNSTDPHDPPLIDPRYLSNPYDVIKTVEGLQVCGRIFSSPSFKGLGLKPLRFLDDGCQKYLKRDEYEYLECVCRNFGNSFAHYAGTAKMGKKSDPSTVITADLKVKGIKNLRVVDASVMPKLTSGNTNIPVIMIAEKASDMIKREWYDKRWKLPYPSECRNACKQ